MGIILFNAHYMGEDLPDQLGMGFRPLMGIILFNKEQQKCYYLMVAHHSFRPLMGIILFNPVFETTGIY